MNLSQAALVIAGHGSTVNADSSAPTHQHGIEIRKRQIFAEVHECFWKEEPNFRGALLSVNAKTVFIVPHFISSGYFTEQVLPREFELTGPVTTLGNRTIYYCEPVGLHETMTDVLLHRAASVVQDSGVPLQNPKQTCLFIFGHGTTLNENSTKIIEAQVQNIKARGIYGDCQAAYMEEAPFIKDWTSMTSLPEIVAVPFFISDGLHSFEDIPVLLGLTEAGTPVATINPHRIAGRNLWYANAIGTEPMMADVILAQVQKSIQNARIDTVPLEVSASEIFLKQWMSQHPAPWKIGQIEIHPGYELRQAGENGPSKTLDLHSLMNWVKRDARGNFRPLRASPNLKPGWNYFAKNLQELIEALQIIYPGALALVAEQAQGSLRVTDFSETAERQTGMYHCTRLLSSSSVSELAQRECGSQCSKQRLWNPAATEPCRNEKISLLCAEACNWFVAKAREQVKREKLS